MAKNRKGKGPAKKQKKQVLGSPREIRENTQTRQKLSAAAKKRHRIRGRFAAEPETHNPYADMRGIGPRPGIQARDYSRRGPTASTPGQKSGAGGRQSTGQAASSSATGARGTSPREETSIQQSNARGMSRGQLENNFVYNRLQQTHGVNPERDEADVRVSHQQVKDAQRQRRSAGWKDKPVYATQGASRSLRSEGKQTSKFIPPSQWLRDEAAPEHAAAIDKMLNDPKSILGDTRSTGRVRVGTDEHGRPQVTGRMTPKQQHSLRVYTRGLQQGKTHQQMQDEMSKERRGAKPQRQRGTTAGIATSDVQTSFRDRHVRQGRKEKYQSARAQAGERNFGVEAEHIDKLSDLGDKFPDMTSRDLIRLQQGQRVLSGDEILKNAKWAQETRAANVRGGKEGTSSTDVRSLQGNADRVVFFTTSLGHPAPSVPADSLVGQYIIRRRKSMLKDAGTKESDLAGNYPDAVRDMHIIEASTGVALGVEGDIGAWKRNGWRIGKRSSRGFGKPTPLGAQVVTDSQGRPIYDEKGNVVYSEGATRRFSLGTKRDLGFRVFIG